MFSAAVYKFYRLGKHYINSSPFLKVKGLLYSCLLIACCTAASWSHAVQLPLDCMLYSCLLIACCTAAS